MESFRNSKRDSLSEFLEDMTTISRSGYTNPLTTPPSMAAATGHSEHFKKLFASIPYNMVLKFFKSLPIRRAIDLKEALLLGTQH